MPAETRRRPIKCMDPEVNGPGGQRTRRSTDPEVNGPGGQWTRRSMRLGADGDGATKILKSENGPGGRCALKSVQLGANRNAATTMNIHVVGFGCRCTWTPMDMDDVLFFFDSLVFLTSAAFRSLAAICDSIKLRQAKVCGPLRRPSWHHAAGMVGIGSFIHSTAAMPA